MKSKGIIIGKFKPITEGHLSLIKYAYDKYDEVSLYVVFTKGETIPIDIRREWINEILGKNTMLDKVKVKTVLKEFSNPEDGKTSVSEISKEWAEWLEVQEKSSEYTTYFVGSEQYIKMMSDEIGGRIGYDIYDIERLNTPISATVVRDSIFESEFLSEHIKNKWVQSVCIVGLESSGKSTLIRDLSSTLMSFGKSVEVADEFGRLYCDMTAHLDSSTDYHLEPNDLVKICEYHNKHILARYRNAYNKHKDNPILLVDTDHIVTLGFDRRYFNHRDPVATREIKDYCNFQTHNIYIFCEPLEIEDDGSRRLESYDRDTEKEWLLQQYNEHISKFGGKLLIINGSRENRLAQVSKFLLQNLKF